VCVVVEIELLKQVLRGKEVLHLRIDIVGGCHADDRRFVEGRTLRHRQCGRNFLAHLVVDIFHFERSHGVLRTRLRRDQVTYRAMCAVEGGSGNDLSLQKALLAIFAGNEFTTLA
jgi:hypothetical protein